MVSVSGRKISLVGFQQLLGTELPQKKPSRVFRKLRRTDSQIFRALRAGEWLKRPRALQWEKKGRPEREDGHRST